MQQKRRSYKNESCSTISLPAFLLNSDSLQIIPGIPLCRPDISPHVAPESQHHVDNNRRAHRKHRSVHKVLSYLAGGETHPVADGRTNAKGVPLNKAFELVHTPKVSFFFE